MKTQLMVLFIFINTKKKYFLLILDSRIFSLAILLSSYLIYNSVGSIDETAIENLSLVVNLSKNIQIKSSSIPAEATETMT